jgi:hypothetical protein
MKRPSMFSRAALRREAKSIGLDRKLGLLVGTAFLSITQLWGAELMQPKPVDPLARIFVGVPNQLTLPPTFPIEADSSVERGAPSEHPGDTIPYKLKLERNEDELVAKAHPPIIAQPGLPLR